MSDVEIGWRRQISTDVRPWAIDMSPAMDVGDVLASATSTLTDLLTGALYPAGLLGSTSVAGTTATQSVQLLVPGHSYRLVVTGAMGGSKESGVSLNLGCPF